MISAESKSLRRGFSLIEVAIALGVVSFAFVMVLGAYGGLLTTSSNNVDRRALMEAVDGLRSELNRKRTPAELAAGELPYFQEPVFRWAQATVPTSGGATATPQELLYLNYRSDASGLPANNGNYVRSLWVAWDGAAATDFNGDPVDLEAYRPALEGRWVKARLQLAPGQGYDTGVPFPATFNDFDRAMLIFQIELETVPAPEAEFPDKPAITCHIGVLQ